MWNIFSTYELKARLVPAIIVLIPVFAALFVSGYFCNVNVIEGIVSIAVLYLIAQVIAKFGRDLQSKLFEKWGGAPSTKIMRWNDSTFTNEQKANIRQALQSALGATLPTSEEESSDPQDADSRIDHVFKEVRSYLYEKESKGLWRSHLAEYGLVRNLLGAAQYAVIIAILSGIFCFYKSYTTQSLIGTYIGIPCLGWALLFIIGRYKFLLSFAEHLGGRYAESAWLAFLSSTRKNGGVS